MAERFRSVGRLSTIACVAALAALACGTGEIGNAPGLVAKKSSSNGGSPGKADGGAGNDQGDDDGGNSGGSGNAQTSGTKPGGNGGKNAGGASTGTGGTHAGTGGKSSTAVSVAITPAAAHVLPGASTKYSAAVTGSTDMAVTWSVQEGTSGGSIDASGNYTAPSTSGTYHVVATSHADMNASGSALAIVSKPSPCSALTNTGKWENIDPPGVTDTTSLAVDPFDSATLWVGANQKGLFKSTDCGATWTHVNTGRSGTDVDKCSLWSIAVDPVDQGTIYLVGGYGVPGLWKTTNGGVDFDQLFPADSEFRKVQDQNFINNVTMDPSDHLHLVTTTHGNCSGAYAPNCMAESTDGGANWRIFTVPYGWDEGGGAYLLDETSWLWCGPFKGMYLTTDNGKTYTDVRPSGYGYGCNGENSNRPLMKSADGAYWMSSVGGVLRSMDGHSWTLAKQGGRYVGMAYSSTTFYVSDNFSADVEGAKFSDPKTWTKLPPPGFPDGQGTLYLDYDEQHKVLYGSAFNGGLWRLVNPSP